MFIFNNDILMFTIVVILLMINLLLHIKALIMRKHKRTVKITTIPCEPPEIIGITEIILPNKCPICGECRKEGYHKKDENDEKSKEYTGIYERKNHYHGIPFIKPRTTVSFYKCLNCGARWKSEPYSDSEIF